MTPSQFFSPDPTARIEPADFVEHFLAQRGLDAARVGLRQTVVLPLIPALERRLLRRLGTPAPQPHPIQHQALYYPAGYPFSVIASPMGAPMAVMLLEQLIALGARRLLYLGFCGALVPSYRIGDLFLPAQAIREEGTSYHYLPADVVPCASPHVQAILKHLTIPRERREGASPARHARLHGHRHCVGYVRSGHRGRREQSAHGVRGPAGWQS